MTAEKMSVAEQQNSKKCCHKSTGIVIAMIGIGIGNTFCQSIVIGFGKSFHKYC